MKKTATKQVTVAPEQPRVSVIDSKGVAANGFAATLKKADLDWDVCEDIVTGKSSGIEFARSKLLYRSDTKRPLGVVGVDYKPTDPREFLKSQYEVAEQLGGKIVRAGWTDRRAQVFTAIKLVEDFKLPKDSRKVGDPISVYIYSTDGWDGKTSRTSSLYLERLRCLNGMGARELGSQFWAMHTGGIEEKVSAAWKEMKVVVAKEIEGLRERFIALAKTKFTEGEVKAFLSKLIPGEGAAAQHKRDKILELFASGTGNEGKTAWDAYNAVTEYATHYTTYKTTDLASAETTRFLGVVEGRNPLPARAIALLN